MYKRPLRVGFVMDPIESINPAKDTTLSIMLEAQSRGWEINYFTLSDIEIKNGLPFGKFRSIQLNFKRVPWFKIKGESYNELSKLDIIFMRKDPPFNLQYLISTYILELAEKEGVLVLNKPSGIRNANEKVFASNFAECCPPSIFTSSKKSILEFLNEHSTIVLKPIDKMGGRSVFVLYKNDPNTYVIIEEITKNETEYVVAQRYIPEINTSGDKRILLVNGEPIPYGISRFPQGVDHRGNMAVGGKAKGFTLTERDLWLCTKIKKDIISQGLFFVGLDVIGDYITEINVTSPTGIIEIKQTSGNDVSKILLDSVENVFIRHLTK